MAIFATTYATGIAILRGMCHLVGDVPYTDTVLQDVLRLAVGEVFARVPLVHDRYWVKTKTESSLGDVRVLTKADDFFRVVELYASSSTATDPPEFTEFREAGLQEVEDEVRAGVVIDAAVTAGTNDPNYLPEQNLFASRGGSLVLNREVDTYTMQYVYDPARADFGVETSVAMSVPDHLLSAVFLLAAWQIESHNNAERAVGHRNAARGLWRRLWWWS